MTIPSSVSVKVPGTTSNIGPGFDCVGAALSLYNQFTFACLEGGASGAVKITATGLEANRIALDERNMVFQAFQDFYKHLGKEPPALALDISLGVPLARGLGSSATAIIGGLLGANALAGSPLSPTEIMELAIATEGHPDNVVPALLGGCQLAASGIENKWVVCDLPWHPDLVPVVAIPDFEVSTAEARRVMPVEYARTDAVFNMAHLGLLLRALATGNPHWLRNALHDRIHQPYRHHLIRGYDAVYAAALDAGAYGLVISGAGPTLLAFTNPDQQATVARAIAEAWVNEGVAVQVKVLELDREGARVTPQTETLHSSESSATG
jgi:homoserine kinase